MPMARCGAVGGLNMRVTTMLSVLLMSQVLAAASAFASVLGAVVVSDLVSAVDQP